jgi:hypothetical protein
MRFQIAQIFARNGLGQKLLVVPGLRQVIDAIPTLAPRRANEIIRLARNMLLLYIKSALTCKNSNKAQNPA